MSSIAATALSSSYWQRRMTSIAAIKPAHPVLNMAGQISALPSLLAFRQSRRSRNNDGPSPSPTRLFLDVFRSTSYIKLARDTGYTKRKGCRPFLGFDFTFALISGTNIHPCWWQNKTPAAAVILDTAVTSQNTCRFGPRSMYTSFVLKHFDNGDRPLKPFEDVASVAERTFSERRSWLRSILVDQVQVTTLPALPKTARTDRSLLLLPTSHST
jgi:hypothetical protein